MDFLFTTTFKPNLPEAQLLLLPFSGERVQQQVQKARFKRFFGFKA